ncbi:MAG TPA: alpha/beta fold hydrolase [Planctomycetota bacterium]|nr:alpha/beta fold hydrolase [Planctomycetota bacterium]
MSIPRWLCLLSAAALAAQEPKWPAPAEGDFVARDFRFARGEVLPELRLHYRTIGKPVRDERGHAQNAVLILHGTTGSGANFLRPEFAGELFARGGLLDAERWFLVLPDAIGHGGSSKPSDGLRMRFPPYDYDDMVNAQHRLLTEHLKVDHLALVLGTSMGGMHAWTWGVRFPEFMDALMPLACLPVEIAGRNRMLRKMAIDSIRGDPAWEGGEYRDQPVQGLTGAISVLLWMGSSPLLWQKEAPTRELAEAKLEQMVASYRQRLDANDVLYAFDASRTYDPSPHLAKIRARVVAINFADDQVNPPELGLLEREIKKVANGRAVVLPISERTRGHGSHTIAALWSEHLKELLRATATDRPVTNTPAQRIWDQREPHAARVWFRRVFEQRQPVTAAEIVVACDNHCCVFVNGTDVGGNDAWEQPTRIDVTKHLVSGDNVIAVAARDDGSAAALVLWLDWRAPHASGTLVTDADWLCCLEEQEGFATLRHDDRRWQRVTTLGEVQRGMNVWGYPPKGANADGQIRVLEVDLGRLLEQNPQHGRLVRVDDAESKRTKSQSDVRAIADAVRMYRVRNGKLPESLDVLARKDERGRSELEELPLDPYGTAFVLRVGARANEFEVVCLGPDGKEGTADDVSSKPRK